jgi:hypothetical protein
MSSFDAATESALIIIFPLHLLFLLPGRVKSYSRVVLGADIILARVTSAEPTRSSFLTLSISITSNLRNYSFSK